MNCGKRLCRKRRRESEIIALPESMKSMRRRNRAITGGEESFIPFMITKMRRIGVEGGIINLL